MKPLAPGLVRTWTGSIVRPYPPRTPRTKVLSRLSDNARIEQVGNLYVLKKGEQWQAFKSLEALTRWLAKPADKRQGKGRKAAKGSARGKGPSTKAKGKAKVKAKPAKPAKDATRRRFKLPAGSRLLAIVSSESRPGVKYHIVQGAKGKPYCDCRAWQNQPGVPPERRTCKHLQAAGF